MIDGLAVVLASLKLAPLASQLRGSGVALCAAPCGARAGGEVGEARVRGGASAWRFGTHVKNIMTRYDNL